MIYNGSEEAEFSINPTLIVLQHIRTTANHQDQVWHTDTNL